MERPQGVGRFGDATIVRLNFLGPVGIVTLATLPNLMFASGSHSGDVETKRKSWAWLKRQVQLQVGDRLRGKRHQSELARIICCNGR